MKRLFLILFLILSSFLFSVNAISTTTLTADGSGWYHMHTRHHFRLNLLVEYAKGNSTQLNIQIGQRYKSTTGMTTTVTFIDSILYGDGIATDDSIVMTATANRKFILYSSELSESIYFYITFTGGTTATANVNLLIDEF